MRNRTWLEHLKDYDFTLQYHHGKANVVPDAFSQKPHRFITFFMIQKWRIIETPAEVDIQSHMLTGGRYLYNMVA